MTLSAPRSAAGPSGLRPHLPVLRLPGVYAPQRDTWLLADVLAAELTLTEAGTRVLELGCGAGGLAAVAARAGATDLTAVDVSRRALICTGLNVRAQRGRVRLFRGDLAAPVAGERFDLVVSNPPYVPAPLGTTGGRGVLRAYDGGATGRLLIDRVCRDAPGLLRPGGRLLMVHSALNGIERTLEAAELGGLDPAVVARVRHPFGPVLQARAAMLERRGLLAAGERTEELVVIRARRPT